jgi:hypothetical protein
MENEDIAVELPPAPAPMLPPGLGMPGAYPAQFLPPAMGFRADPHHLHQQHQALLQQAAQRLAQQARGVAQPGGRYYGGMVDPQRVYQELQANRAAERRRDREAALRREQERLQAVAAMRVRQRVVANPAPPPAAIPAPRRNPRRR